MNTTVRLKTSDITKDWHVLDAEARSIGRVATEAARLLRGKHKATYEPHLDDGDFVIIVNAAKVKMTGRKREQIRYYRHSGFPGGLRTRTFEEQFARFPDRVVERAVHGMLPGGPLGKAMARHLKVYAGPNHPHQSQVVGSERARAAREAAADEAGPAPLRPRRLRPLSVPDEVALAAPVSSRRRSPEAAASPPPVAVVETPAGELAEVAEVVAPVEAEMEPEGVDLVAENLAAPEADEAEPAAEESAEAAGEPGTSDEAPPARRSRKRTTPSAEE
jgi:large subunit ribosomal protein L13